MTHTVDVATTKDTKVTKEQEGDRNRWDSDNDNFGDLCALRVLCGLIHWQQEDLNVRPFVGDADPVRSAAARGMLQHFCDDLQFHDSRAFAELNVSLAAAAGEAPEAGRTRSRRSRGPSRRNPRMSEPMAGACRVPCDLWASMVLAAPDPTLSWPRSSPADPGPTLPWA